MVIESVQLGSRGKGEVLRVLGEAAAGLWVGRVDNYGRIERWTIRFVKNGTFRVVQPV